MFAPKQESAESNGNVFKGLRSQNEEASSHWLNLGQIEHQKQ